MNTKPNINPYRKALSNLYWLLSYVLGLALFALLLSFVSFQTLTSIWPYDFGELNRWNVITPGVIFGFAVLFFCRFIVRKSLYNEAYFLAIAKTFEKESVKQPLHNWLLNLMYANAIGMFVALVLHYEWLALVFAFLFVVQECWLRVRYKA